jgi:hypothetical protein
MGLYKMSAKAHVWWIQENPLLSEKQKVQSLLILSFQKKKFETRNPQERQQQTTTYLVSLQLIARCNHGLNWQQLGRRLQRGLCCSARQQTWHSNAKRGTQRQSSERRPQLRDSASYVHDSRSCTHQTRHGCRARKTQSLLWNWAVRVCVKLVCFLPYPPTSLPTPVVGSKLKTLPSKGFQPIWSVVDG